MAIYHLTIKNISRGQGRSAVAAAAYRRAARLYDERYGKFHDYKDKSDVIHRELLIPLNAPHWVKNLKALDQEHKALACERLWNLVEAAEKRCDARLAKEIEFALPMELTQTQSIALARDFLQTHCADKGMIADWSLHWDTGNPHVHVMLTTRELIEEGFGKKVTAWNDKALVTQLRQGWAEMANYYLHHCGYETKIDHRSYQEQGIELIPTKHLGKAVHDMERRGIKTELMQQANEIRVQNLKLIAQKPHTLLHKVDKEKNHFDRHKLAHEMTRYATPNTLQTQSFIPLPLEEIKKLLATMEYHHSVFTEQDIAKVLHETTDNAELFAQALTQVMVSPELMALGKGEDGRDHFTTKRLFDLENKLQKQAIALKEKTHQKINVNEMKRSLTRYTQQTGKVLTDEQTYAVKHIVSSASMTCLVGRAGTGKSFTLGAANAIWRAKGLSVQGVALSGIAAEGLMKSSGIPSQTIDSFCYALEKQHIQLTKNTILVMDEAGMTDADSMAKVLHHVTNAQAKLVLVGDPAQLQPVGPGATFRALLSDIGYAELQQVYRQKADWQKHASMDLSAGQIKDALKAYAEHHCIQFADNEDQAKMQLIAAWSDDRKDTTSIYEQLIITHQNTDVSELNLMAREQRLALNEIKGGYAINSHLGKCKISIGERLVFTKNDKQQGVRNGSFGTVTNIVIGESGQPLYLNVILDGDDKKEVSIDLQRYQHFTYGYAATVHKVQGLTVDKSYVYVGESSWDKNLSYVALTRHRDQCVLYTNKTNYPDVESLAKTLGRYAMKDSVLDYAVNFAKRRGIEPAKEKLTQSLGQKLRTLTEQIKITFAQNFNAKSYWAQKEKENAKAQEQLETLKRREEAVIIAKYVDSHRQVGMAFAKVKEEMQRLGMETLRYDEVGYAIVIHTDAYRELRHSMQQRNELASQIYVTRHKYDIALNIYSIDQAKLLKEAQQHECYQRIYAYEDALKQGKTVIRDKLAHEISQAIKSHYGELMLRGFAHEIYLQAKKHQRRLLLASLTPAQRKQFYTIEQYQKLTKNVGKRYQAIQAQHAQGSVIKREQLHELEIITQKRNQLAAHIYHATTLYQAGLDFYEIGKVEQPDECTEEKRKQIEQRIKYAKQRWEKLATYALQHENAERIQHYALALYGKELNARKQLAYEIVNNTKGHHGAILKLTDRWNALWKQIYDDAHAYQRDKFFETLDNKKQQAFLQVEDYREAQKASGQIWREILTAKNEQQLMPEQIEVDYRQKAKSYRMRRDELAARILQQPEDFQPALQFYHMDATQLEKSARSYDCRERVVVYKEMLFKPHSLQERAMLAQRIAENTKAHHGVLLEANLTWKSIYRDIRCAQKQKEFHQLSSDEKRLYRLVKKYRYANRTLGKLGSKIKHHETNPLEKDKLSLLTAKRDYVAHQLKSVIDGLKFKALFEENALIDIPSLFIQHKLNQQKLDKQAHRYKTKLEMVTHWQEVHHKLTQELRSVNISTLKSEQSASRFLEWLEGYQEHRQLSVKLAKSHYRYALHSIGLSSQQMTTHVAQLKQLKQLANEVMKLNTLSHQQENQLNIDNEQIKRLGRAREIVKQSKSITGTLAEKYLREHRAIQGALPSTFRYHPSMYHGATGKRYPALVVIAQDKQQHTKAVQVIYLDPHTANKALGKESKRTYGLLKETHASVLVNQGKDKSMIAIAEGPETALSIAEANPELTVYAALGSSNFGNIPLSNEVKEIIFCADNDGVNATSDEKVKAAATYFAERGMMVWQAKPDIPEQYKKYDFNDVLKEQGKDKVLFYLRDKQLISKGITLDNIQQQIENITGRITKDQIIVCDDNNYTISYSDMLNVKLYMETFDKVGEAHQDYIICRDPEEKQKYEGSLYKLTQEFNNLSEIMLKNQKLMAHSNNISDFTDKSYLDGTYIKKLIKQTLETKSISKIELTNIVRYIRSTVSDLSKAKAKSRGKGR